MRQFSFVLQVDDEDRYELVECKPSIDVTILLDIAGMLNETDDMSEMVRRMSKLFHIVEHLKSDSTHHLFLTKIILSSCRTILFGYPLSVISTVSGMEQDV
jgi:hypothetical protein